MVCVTSLTLVIEVDFSPKVNQLFFMPKPNQVDVLPQPNQALIYVYINLLEHFFLLDREVNCQRALF